MSRFALACSILLLTAQLSAQASVATHYFYWYRWPGEHFKAGRAGAEGHRRQFVAPDKVSYLDPAWHRAQFRAMAGCGIDIALPVYWGAPGAYQRPSLRFSRAGLQPMVRALDALRQRGEPGVRLGLFYDTSTLLCDVRGVEPRGGRADLTGKPGQELFCRTVTGFFAEIPPRHWARIDSAALVVLYSAGFAAGWDASLGPVLRRAFAARFPGEKLFLVADVSWGEIGQDRTTAWGAALAGPRLFEGVAQIGPGYDDSPVPGRRTPIRDREDGRFYSYSWRQAVLAKPELVLIETWNEMHEGTEICATKELGTKYRELTRQWVARLRKGEPGPAIELRHAQPKPRADRSWGATAVGLAEVSADFVAEPLRRAGLREISWADGPIRLTKSGLHSMPARPVRYVYFQLSDFWQFDVDCDLRLRVEVDGAPGRLGLEYDSHQVEATLGGSYTAARRSEVTKIDGGSRLVFELPRARLANRQNGGADLRFRVLETGLTIRRIVVQKLERR